MRYFVLLCLSAASLFAAGSLVDAAKAGDKAAIRTMLQQMFEAPIQVDIETAAQLQTAGEAKFRNVVIEPAADGPASAKRRVAGAQAV